MSQMTVKEVRVRLGRIVAKVFTESFTELYEMIAAQFDDSEKIADIITAHLMYADAYIDVMSEELLSPHDKLEKINSFAHPLVVFSVGVRYHWITMDLIKRNQKEKVIMPSDDKSFFREMLITYWKSLFPELAGRV